MHLVWRGGVALGEEGVGGRLPGTQQNKELIFAEFWGLSEGPSCRKLIESRLQSHKVPLIGERLLSRLLVVSS